MNQKNSKSIRRIARKEANEATKKNYMNNITMYVEKLCREPLRVRLSYMWSVMRRRNPHTGEKYTTKKVKKNGK